MRNVAHRLRIIRSGHWETRDGRITLFRDDGKWHATPMSVSDARAASDAGLSAPVVEYTTYSFPLGLGLRDTARVVALAIGADPSIRWRRDTAYLVEDDAGSIQYTLVLSENRWRVTSHCLLERTPAVVHLLETSHRTRTGALDALAAFLALGQPPLALFPTRH